MKPNIRLHLGADKAEKVGQGGCMNRIVFLLTLGAALVATGCGTAQQKAETAHAAAERGVHKAEAAVGRGFNAATRGIRTGVQAVNDTADSVADKVKQKLAPSKPSGS